MSHRQLKAEGTGDSLDVNEANCDNCSVSSFPSTRNLRSSKRNKSGQTHLDPNFIYGDFVEEISRSRSGSWSSSNKAAVVERKVTAIVKPKNKQKRLALPSSPVVKDPFEASLRSGRNKSWLSGVNAPGNQVQVQRQQDVARWAELSCLQKDALAPVTSSDTNPFVDDHDCNKLQEYGSNYESYLQDKTKVTSIKGLATTGNPSVAEMAPGGPEHTEPITEVNQEMEAYEQEWRKVLEGIQSEMKVKMTRTIEEMKTKFSEELGKIKKSKFGVRGAENVDVIQLRDDVASAKTQVATVNLQMREVSGAVIRQQQEIGECKDDIEGFKGYTQRKVLKIRGLLEAEQENCKEVVKDFFTQKLGITSTIVVTEAFRLGKGDNRPMKVVLKNPRHKAKIFKNTKKLKDVTNDMGDSFYVDDQITAKRFAERGRQRQIVAENKKVQTTADKLVLSFKNRQMLINGREYEKGIQTPTCRDILQATPQQRLQRMKIKLQRSGDVKVEGQLFVGYTFCPQNLQEVNIAYAKVKALHTDARHILCAVRLPGRDFHVNRDFCGDDEHGGGIYLLRTLMLSEVQNQAIFIVRVYDGKHIGLRRFQAMFDAASSAVDRAPVNTVTGEHDKLWQQQQQQQQKNPIQSSARPIRGGYNGGQRRNMVYNRQRQVENPPRGAPTSPLYSEIVNNNNRATSNNRPPAAKGKLRLDMDSLDSVGSIFDPWGQGDQATPMGSRVQSQESVA